MLNRNYSPPQGAALGSGGYGVAGSAFDTPEVVSSPIAQDLSTLDEALSHLSKQVENLSYRTASVRGVGGLSSVSSTNEPKQIPSSCALQEALRSALAQVLALSLSVETIVSTLQI